MTKMNFAQFKPKNNAQKYEDELDEDELDAIVDDVDAILDSDIITVKKCDKCGREYPSNTSHQCAKCEYCGKYFTNIKNHKCKQSPEAMKQIEDAIDDRIHVTEGRLPHMEDMYFTSDEIWAEIKNRKHGEIKNWFTRNHPRSDECVRDSALDQLTNIFNLLLMKKIMRLR